MSALNPNNPNGGGAGVKDIAPILTNTVSKGNPDEQPVVKGTGSDNSKNGAKFVGFKSPIYG